MLIYTVDAFTAEPFKGNPAAVCVLEKRLEEGLMQRIAFEMNLSETAFVGIGSEPFELRWFTPRVEVDLCGHATLASAHVLWETGIAGGAERIEFSTRSGVLSAARSDTWIEMDFPSDPPAPSLPPTGLADALGVEPRSVWRAKFDYLVEVDSEKTLRRLAPDFEMLARLVTRGVIVTCGAESERFDFTSRFFAPAVGVQEDPVTGSSHCALAPFWRERLGRDAMTAYQASERGGVLRVRARGERVSIAGQAVTVLRGTLAGV